MDDSSSVVIDIKSQFPKLYVTEIRDNDIKFGPEQDEGHVEYKRTIAECSEKKAEHYATQMHWRISENLKYQSATYFIGIDDDGTIIGLTNQEVLDCITRFVTIANTIKASIRGIQVIHTNDQLIIKITVKIKKIKDNYLEFGDKF